MEDTQTAAFWSYAHEDDRLDNGGILRLAERLKNEYALISPQELALFVDRTGIEWGDEWRSTIDGALARTSFFIPVISSRYFERAECRKEFIDFHSAAQSLGSTELILPILYAPVDQFDNTNPNELIALASRFQYVDWSELRLEDFNSPEVKKAVHALAKRLVEVGKRVKTTQMDKEISLAEGRGEARGALELIEEIDAMLPAWSDSVEGGVVGGAQFQATYAIYGPRLEKLERQSGKASARFALTQRLAVQALPLARNRLELAQAYVRKSIELDPLMTELIQMLERDPSLWELAENIDAALSEAQGPMDEWIDQQEGRLLTVAPWARRRAHISRVVNELAETAERSEALVAEGNEIVLRWMAQWTQLAAHQASSFDEDDGGNVEGAALDA